MSAADRVDELRARRAARAADRAAFAERRAHGLRARHAPNSPTSQRRRGAKRNPYQTNRATRARNQTPHSSRRPGLTPTEPGRGAALPDTVVSCSASRTHHTQRTAPCLASHGRQRLARPCWASTAGPGTTGASSAGPAPVGRTLLSRTLLGDAHWATPAEFAGQAFVGQAFVGPGWWAPFAGRTQSGRASPGHALPMLAMPFCGALRQGCPARQAQQCQASPGHALSGTPRRAHSAGPRPAEPRPAMPTRKRS